jgi:hypothetical protein
VRILDLALGARVRIKTSFRDFDRREHRAGTVLRLVSRDFFPHDDGYTFRFEDGTVMRLAGIDPACDAILGDGAGVYFEAVPG